MSHLGYPIAHFGYPTPPSFDFHTSPARSQVGYPAMLQRQKSIAVLIIKRRSRREKEKRKKREKTRQKIKATARWHTWVTL